MSRFSNSEEIDIEKYHLIEHGFGEDEVRDAIKHLEEAVKMGQVYRAADLSDWISFIAHSYLSKNPESKIKIDIERIKRIDYLGFTDRLNILVERFFEDYAKCSLKKFRENCTQIDNIAPKNKFSKNPWLSNLFYLNFFTAIGHKLWHAKKGGDVAHEFLACEFFVENIAKEHHYHRICSAFLEGLKGKRSFLENRHWKEAHHHFEHAFEILSQDEQNSRTGLHIIKNHIKVLLDIYREQEKKEDVLENTISNLLEKFRDKKLFSENPHSGISSPLQTLLWIEFQILAIEFLGECRRTEENKKNIQLAKFDLYISILEMGLAHHNPAPPLIKRYLGMADDRLKSFNITEATNYLAYLIESMGKENESISKNNAPWKKFERIASLFYESNEYEIIWPPEGAEAFDFFAKNEHGLIAVQVKFYHCTIRKVDMTPQTAYTGKYRDEITRIDYFVSARTVKADKISDSLCRLFPKIREVDIKFIDIRTATEMFMATPKLISKIISVIRA